MLSSDLSTKSLDFIFLQFSLNAISNITYNPHVTLDTLSYTELEIPGFYSILEVNFWFWCSILMVAKSYSANHSLVRNIFDQPGKDWFILA